MKIGAEIYVYGALDDNNVDINTKLLIGRDITVKGFLLNHYL